MTELTCWPLDNKQYFSDALGAAYAARSRGLLRSDNFTATTNGDNTLTISKGVACVHVTDFWAAFPFLKQDTVMQFEDADGVYMRWDVLAVGYDKNANMAGVYVRTGVAAPSPEMPAVRRDNDFDEVFLYGVRRRVGATKIEADDIVDLRLDPDYCGLMRDTIDSIDTSVMQAAFEAFLAKIEQELDRLNASTETMLKTTYDTKGRGVDVYDYGPHLYKATFLLDGWTGDGPYTQTVAVTPVDDGPAVTSGSTLLACIGTDSTLPQETKDAMAGPASDIAGAEKTLGAGTISVTLDSAPDVDVELYFYIKQGVSPAVPPLDPVGAGSGMKLLWTNPAPGNPFQAQEVGIDLTSCIGVVCVFQYTTAGGINISAFGPMNLQTDAIMRMGVSDLSDRKFTPTSTGVQFTLTTDQNGGERADWIVPIRIYGVKN